MSLIGKNRKVYSYNNQIRRESNFQYKDFEKVKCYHTDFGKAIFSGASLRAAHMKFCNFNGALFNGTEFVGTNLRGSSFKGASFINAIFQGVVLDKTDFTGATFENCLFIGARTNGVKGLDCVQQGITVINKVPAKEDLSPQLVEVIENLRENDIIRKSHTLHGKNNSINTVYVNELMKEYSEQELIELFPHIEEHITTQFYTLSYLKVLLKKVKNSGNL